LRIEDACSQFLLETQSLVPNRTWVPTTLQYVVVTLKALYLLGHGRWTFGAHAQNGSRYSLLSQFLFPLPGQRLYVVNNMYVEYLTAYETIMNYRCYQIKLRVEHFYKSEAVRSVDWIFIAGMPAWRWLGKYVTVQNVLVLFSNRQ